MKKTGLLALATFSLLTALPLSAQTPPPVTTDPVGFLKITLPGAATGQSTVTPVGLPLAMNAVEVGAIATIPASNKITVSGASWTVNKFAAAGAPHFLKIVETTSSAVGRFFLITANGASDITVDALGANLTTLLSPGVKFQIYPGHTIGNLFGTTTATLKVPGLLTGENPNAVDLVRIYGVFPPSTIPTWVNFWNTGTQWVRIGSEDVSTNDTPIYPDEGFLFVRRGTTALTLTVVGAVPTTAEQTQVSGPGTTSFANRFPVQRTLGSLGLETLPNWIKSENPNAADVVRIFETIAPATSPSWVSYWHTGTQWIRIGSDADQAAAKIEPGTSLIVVRRSSSGSTDYLKQSVPY